MKKQLIKALVVAIGIAGATTNAWADRLQDILSNGVIRVAVSLDSPPFGSVGADGKPVGLDIEMAEMVAQALNVKLETVGVPSANRVAVLVTDKADLVISNLGMTPERAKQVLYSAPYVNTVLGVFGSKDLPVTKLDDLTSYTVSATRGAAATQAILSKNPNAQVKQFESDSLSATAFLSGQTDLLTSSTTTVAALKKQNPDKPMELLIALRSSPAHMAVRMGELNFLAWVNSFIYYSQLNGDLDRLSQKYLDLPLQPLELALPTR